MVWDSRCHSFQGVVPGYSEAARAGIGSAAAGLAWICAPAESLSCLRIPSSIRDAKIIDSNCDTHGNRCNTRSLGPHWPQTGRNRGRDPQRVGRQRVGHPGVAVSPPLSAIGPAGRNVPHARLGTRLPPEAVPSYTARRRSCATGMKPQHSAGKPQQSTGHAGRSPPGGRSLPNRVRAL